MAEPEGDQLERALAALQRGEVIAAATDTVYGLLCDPSDEAAVQRVYDLKERPADLELSLLAASARDLEQVVSWNTVGRALAERFWPGALSLVLPVGSQRLAVPRAGTSLSIRVPAAPALCALLRRSGPLASTSANRHGQPAATSSTEVELGFGGRLAALFGGDQPGGAASSIIDCSVTPPRVLRSGPIDSRALRAYLQG